MKLWYFLKGKYGLFVSRKLWIWRLCLRFILRTRDQRKQGFEGRKRIFNTTIIEDTTNLILRLKEQIKLSWIILRGICSCNLENNLIQTLLNPYQPNIRAFYRLIWSWISLKIIFRKINYHLKCLLLSILHHEHLVNSLKRLGRDE